MKPLAHQFLDTLKIVILAALLVVGVQYVFAWSGPPGNPPPDPCPSGQPGCDAPVNVSSNLQVKLGDLGVKSFTADNTQINGTLNVLNAITATGGTFSGAVSGTSLSAGSGGITGGSLDVGTGVVTGGQGTFTDGVVVGDTADTNTPRYFQVDAVNVNIPPSGDCNSPEEYGKMVYDIDTHFLYICGKDSAAPTWRRVSTNTP